MPVIPVSFGGGAILNATTTVQNIIDGTAQDIRQQLSSVATPGETILIDYANRVSLTLLRASRWTWLLSSPQRFLTQTGVSDYWIGPTGSAPIGVYDTTLDLVDIDRIKENTVYDRSNYRRLDKVNEVPLSANLAFRDEISRPGRPTNWRQSLQDTPNVLNIYPAADNVNNYQPAPNAPACTIAQGGALGNRIYYVRTTFIDSQGNESSASSTPAKIFVPAGNLLVVLPPVEPAFQSAAGILYSRYNVYASTTLGSETLQASSVFTPTANNWVEPTSGVTTSGAIFPTANNVAPVDGYIIEFRYWKQRQQMASPGQILQIPDVYKDVVIAGVNSFAFQYLNRPQESMRWTQVFQSGIVGIIRDRNLYISNDYIGPDMASVGTGTSPLIEPFDLAALG